MTNGTLLDIECIVQEEWSTPEKKFPHVSDKVGGSYFFRTGESYPVSLIACRLKNARYSLL